MYDKVPRFTDERSEGRRGRRSAFVLDIFLLSIGLHFRRWLEGRRASLMVHRAVLLTVLLLERGKRMREL